MSKTSALDLFNSLSLDEIRAQIAVIDEQIGTLENQRDCLRQLERAVDIRENGKPKKQWNRKKKTEATDAVDSDDPGAEAATDATQQERPRTGGRQPSPETIALRQRIYQYLRIHGPMGVSEISKALKAEYGKVQNALYDKQFVKKGALWSLA